MNMTILQSDALASIQVFLPITSRSSYRIDDTDITAESAVGAQSSERHGRVANCKRMLRTDAPTSGMLCHVYWAIDLTDLLSLPVDTEDAIECGVVDIQTCAILNAIMDQVVTSRSRRRSYSCLCSCSPFTALTELS